MYDLYEYCRSRTKYKYVGYVGINRDSNSIMENQVEEHMEHEMQIGVSWD